MIGPHATAARAGHRDETRDGLVIIDTDGCALVDALVFAHGKTGMAEVTTYTILRYPPLMPPSPMSGLSPVRRLQTVLTEEEWARLEKYLKKHNVRVYTLLKKALFVYMEKNP